MYTDIKENVISKKEEEKDPNKSRARDYAAVILSLAA